MQVADGISAVATCPQPLPEEISNRAGRGLGYSVMTALHANRFYSTKQAGEGPKLEEIWKTKERGKRGWPGNTRLTENGKREPGCFC